MVIEMRVKPLLLIILIIVLANCVTSFIDNIGPNTSNVVVSPSYNNGIFNLTATTEDTYSPIKTVEYFVGFLANASCGTPGTGNIIYPLDGNFDLDNLVENLKAENIEYYDDGLNWVCIQAQDNANNWGNCECIYFETDATPPYYPYNISLDNILYPDEYLVCGNNPWLNATVCDKESYIQGGEYFIDLVIPPIPNPWSGYWMNVLKEFNKDSYHCAVIGASVNTSDLEDGTHYLRLRGKDTLENWGKLQNSPVVSFIKDTTAPSTNKTLNPFEGAQFDCYGYEESEADVYNKSLSGLTNGCYYVKNGTTITLNANDFNPQQTGEFAGNVIIYYKVWWKQNPEDPWQLDQEGQSGPDIPVTINLTKDSYHLVEYWSEDLCGWEEEHHFELDIIYECESSEVARECIDDGYANVTYDWNYEFCGESYIETEEDQSCSCQYDCWQNDECVSDGFMRQVRYETTSFEYCDDEQYQEVPDEVCDCESSETGRICIDDGFADVTYGWNYDYCGQEYTETVQDSSCSCDYTEWTDYECISDGIMFQTRTETSGYPYCISPLEQEVPNEICNCEAEETGRVCVDDGYAEVTYGWNYDYCGDSYNETIEDQNCLCQYTCWGDDECVSDGYMRQIRTELSGYEYCTDPLEQEVPNEVCNCESSEVGRICIDDGYAEVTYSWNYDYCGDSFTDTVEDETCSCEYTDWQDDECVSDGIMLQIRTETTGYEYCTDPLEQEVPNDACNCESSETGRICIDDGFADVTYGWNYDYCGDSFIDTVEDESCSCEYTCWEDDECVSDGYMRQIRTELSGYEYCTDPLEQEVPNEVCNCESSEVGRICIDDGYAEVTYSWNYDYCGDSFTDTVEDETCGCEYTCWEDDECVSDGIMLQIRTETTGYEYCTDPLEQEVPNDACNCESSETGRICIDDGFADVTYGWNYDYCGDSFIDTVEDESCSCEYTCWEDDECVSDGYMRQIRTETTGYDYCTESLEQEVPNEICDCESSETGRECIDDGFAEITFGWNYDYCGQEYTDIVQDSSCSCEYTCWEDDECVSDGIRKQVKYETTSFGYCDDELYQEISDEECDCELSEFSRECVNDGYAEITYEFNYDYCGEPEPETVEDQSCSCQYGCWQDLECVSDGYIQQIRYETTDFEYCEDTQYQEVPNEVCDCESSETGRVCIDDGYAEVTYGWNYDYCGQEYTDTVQDTECSCDYTGWQDDECVSDGYMRQIRTETSGYVYCTSPLEQEVPDEICDCQSSEVGRVCIDDGYAEVTYGWNYAYCGDSYNETVQDSSCSCDYTDWQDDECVSDGYMRQIRTETTNYAYCTAPLEQEVPNEICDCQSSEIGRECVSDGYAEITYGWNYDYCGDSYNETVQDTECSCDYTVWEDDVCVSDGQMRQIRYENSGYAYCTDALEQEVQNEICDCESSETGRVCIDDGYAEITYTWNYDYCGDSFTDTVEDQNCLCQYTCWQDEECVSDGMRRQIKYETTSFGYCDDELYQEIPDEECDCQSSEIGRECVDNGHAEVTYGWNYDYCGCSYTETVEDQTCGCEYTCWQDEECVSDGMRRQIRYETTDFDYCNDELYQEIPDEECDCQSSEIGRECVDNGHAEVTYGWNYDYCGCSYTETVEDQTCGCEYTCWQDEECVSDGMRRQIRYETTDFDYCNDELYQEIPDEECDCELSEFSRECVSDGYAKITYEFNYDYCGEPEPETVEDQSCSCQYGCWQDLECVSDGYMQQVRYETTDFEYCEDTQYQEVENPDCTCESEETGRECVSDGYSEITYTWNYDYCGCSYTETVEDQSCLCNYTEWQYDECVSEGYLRQTRTELSGHEYCTEDLERTVEHSCCTCKYTEWQDIECISEEYMQQVRYETTEFDYCDDEQYQEIEDAVCNCDYLEWQDDECVEDGIMQQIRTEASGHDYCNESLTREIQNDICSCISTEISRECAANATALVNYSWNYPYCEPDSEYVYDESCLICIPDWICIKYSNCTSENYQYCTQVQDTNNCEECYTGDYSEFIKECSYCSIHGPKITTADEISVYEGDLVTLDIEMTDPDQDPLTYSISAPVGNDKQWQTQEGDKGEYNVLITVSDGICTTTETIKIIVKEESQQSLIIKKTNYNEFIKPGQTQELYITLENTGNENLEDLKITAFIDSLGIWKTTRKFDLKKGDETTKLIELDIPYYAPKGRHYIRIVVSNDKIRRVIYRDFDVI